MSVDVSVVYAPHGPYVPVAEHLQGPFLEELSEALRPHLPASCQLLRYDLPWRDPYTASGEWSERPERSLRG